MHVLEQRRIAAESKDKSGIDGGRVPVSTPHDSQGTQAYQGADVGSGGLPRTRRATFRVSGARGGCRTRAKQAQNG